ncbi:hypothetical protein NZL82_01650 [Sphingomonas sanguinis]|uniref:hypothetical protein n=1 Tax=Sphingomonas sp. LC-1 TaxID=3110957 RepID=UPI0021BA45E5|nr:hypothetical protein [Sphingomonas sp. LC-1]MCT8000576.1 hypothetical protein [Sphingomonas sp. LC-1]
MSNDLQDAIAKAAKAKPAPKPRKVKVSERGRPPSDTSRRRSAPIHTPTALAELLDVHRDTVYDMEREGLTRSVDGKGFTLPDVFRFVKARERAAGREEASDPKGELEFEKIRGERAKNDIIEDSRDEKRRKLIEVELAVAVYEDDATHVAVHLRGLGAKLMQDLAIVDDPDAICDRIDEEVEKMLEHLNAEHVDPNCEDCHPYLGGVEIEGRA